MSLAFLTELQYAKFRFQHRCDDRTMPEIPVRILVFEFEAENPGKSSLLVWNRSPFALTYVEGVIFHDDFSLCLEYRDAVVVLGGVGTPKMVIDQWHVRPLEQVVCSITSGDTFLYIFRTVHTVPSVEYLGIA